MRNLNLLLGLLLLPVLTISCIKDDKIQILTYHYEKFASNLNESVSCIFFVNENFGYAANYSGKVFKTIDNGISWQSDSLTDLPLRSICFINKDIGFIVGGLSSCGGTGCTVPGSIVYKTTNGGLSWTKQSTPYTWSELNSVYFIDKNIGFAVGLGLQLKTTNGGETWEKFEFEYKGLMDKVQFINSQTGFAAGLFGNIFKTTDQGRHWSKTDNESDGHIYDFCFVNKNIGYAAGQKEIVKTVNGGITWTILTNSPRNIFSVHFTDILNGIAIGFGHYTGGDWGFWTSAIYFTSDGGNTWKMEDNIDFGPIISFPYNNLGYSLGWNSTYKIIIE